MTTQDSLFTALRATANSWALKARDHARTSKGQQDEKLAAYYRGVAETYHKLAMEIAELVQNQPKEAAPAQQAASAAPPAPEATPPAPQWDATPLHDALLMLEYGGIPARDVTPSKNNTFYAIFSRWQPFSEHERIEKIKAADPRVVIISSGKNAETGDPYIEFAFKPFGT